VTPGIALGHHDPVRHHLPTGTVTFLFTDIEGSTKLLHELGAEAYARALAEHRRVLRAVFVRHGGVEVDTQGDAFFYAFPSGSGALEAAREGQQALSSTRIRVRIGIHTGTPHRTEEGYVGDDVHKGARIAAAGHGGQVLLSKETRALVDADVMDLGEHHVKDFNESVWIYQLGSERFPPLKTISNTNLPRPASSFVGRERELKEVLSLLQAGTRLLTLSGPGGSGKTRLAIEAAAELMPEFRNGVFWVGLAAVRDSALVTEEIAQTLGAKDGLADFVAERELLLLLDNFEQVVDAAPGLSTLLSASPNLRVMVTSRELLRIQGEVEYAVPPLAQAEAIELFCTRSRLEPDATIAELCRRLDDLPLAVELAAARTSVLAPAQILERISKRLDLLKGGRDADPRQATLRATIEWSFDLLAEWEKSLFARLAVFTGGCTLESAEEVAEADLDTLQSLVDKSLVRHTRDRFWMLETIREYAAERLLDSSDAEELPRRHAEHFLALAEEAEPHLFRYSKEWLDRVESELDNLRAAFDRLVTYGDGELALRLVGAVAEFWGIRGHLAEGRRRFESALAADDRPTKARAKALNGAADVALGSGDNEAAKIQAEEALRIHRMLGDAWGVADSLFLFGVAAANEDEFVTAQMHLDESARIFRELGDQHQAMLATRILAWTYEELGDRERARAQHQDNLRQARTAGIKDIEGHSLEGLAHIAMSEGRPEVALPMLDEAYRVCRDLGDLYRIPIIVSRFARGLALVGRAGTAVRVLSCSEALQKETGSSTRWVTKMNEETLATIRTQLDEAAIAEAWEQGRTLTADQAIALALDSTG
jgi:predicted ATPase/class 3 adenylate cyclase